VNRVQITDMRKEAAQVAYETKVVLKAIGKIIKVRAENSEDKEPYRTIYNDVSEVANAEGVTLEPFEDE